MYKGIMNGKSTGVFNGKIYVRQDAQKTNAFQSNRNVLLSDDASIFTKPQLEIWADDVKCSHGATTGQIDEEALFYLQSRGISKDTAKALLMIAFASEVVQEIKIKEVKEYVEEIIHNMLHD
jgi:Fe-S cluster assembly protein SufD